MTKMNFSEFKSLDLEQQLELMNKYMTKLYASGKTTKDFFEFDTSPFNFSYSSWQKHIKPYGYFLDRDTKQFVKAFNKGEQEVANINKEQVVAENNNIEQETVNINNKKQEVATLNKSELMFVKQLYKKHQVQQSNADVKATTLVVPVRKGQEKKTTGVSVYVDMWDRFNAFKDTTSFSGTDLLAVALQDFLDKYDK